MKSLSENKKQQIARMLTIAGSDCSGGAGIQADLKIAEAYQCYGMSIITAITAQNTKGVYAIEEVSPEMISAQFNAIMDDIPPQAIKIGMIASPKAAECISKMLSESDLGDAPIVIDPVLVSSSGTTLSTSLSDTSQIISQSLFSIATVVTPNIPEAEYFLGYTIEKGRCKDACHEFLERYNCEAIYLKGGHTLDDYCDDFLLIKGMSEPYVFSSRRIISRNTHGTGCTLSSSIACGLALNKSIYDACEEAHHFIENIIQNSVGHNIGNGCGPLLLNNTLNENNI